MKEKAQKEKKEKKDSVSVPLRGRGDESFHMCKIRRETCLLVSVPLRGRGDESPSPTTSANNSVNKFQSPCGEGVMKEAEGEGEKGFRKQVSVPLRGRGDERGDDKQVN